MIHELKKIVFQKTMWILTIILIAANLFLINEFDSKERNDTESYQYSRTEYVDFLDQIPEQTKELSSQPEYENHNSFLYRNLIKTEKDYSVLNGGHFKEGKFTALVHYSKYPYQILFIIFFVLFAGYQALPAERRKGYYLLLKSTVNGRMKLYINKFFSLFTLSALFSIICDLSGIIYYRVRYGNYGIGYALQSSLLFRDCPYRITVGQALIIITVIHIAISFFASAFILMLFSVIKRNEVSIVLYGAFFALEAFLDKVIVISSGQNILAAVNTFYQSRISSILGNYLNVNILGFPVSQIAAGAVTILGLSVLFVIIGGMRFSHSFQIEGDSLIERIMNKLRGKLSFIWRTDKIAVFEFGKILFHERKLLLLIVLLILSIGFTKKSMSPLVFVKPEDAEYHRLLAHLQGKADDDKLGYIKKQRKKLDKLVKESEKAGDNDALQKYYEFEFERRNLGLQMLENQRDQLYSKAGGHVYFYDEAALSKQFDDTRTDLLLFLITGAVLVIILCGMEHYDQEMSYLLNTTVSGERTIRKKKRKASFVIMAICFALWNIPDLISYIRIDHGKNLLAPVSQITRYSMKVPVCELVFFAVVLFLRFALILALIVIINKLSVKIKSQTAVGVIGVITVLLIYLVCLILNSDVITLVIKIFS